jgi:hypothetical protein
MSGAVRAAWPVDVVGTGTRRGADNTVLTVATPHRSPRDTRPATATVGRNERESLVMRADAAMQAIVSAAACHAEAGVC